MENKQKIQNLSKKAVQVLDIIKVLLIMMISLLGVLIIVLAIGIFTEFLYNYINNNIDTYGNFVIRIRETNGIVSITNKITLKELIDSEQFYNYMGNILGKSFVLIMNFSITLVLIGFFKKLFAKLMVSESPFNEEVLKQLKSVFIVTTILVVINGLAVGVIVGLALACFYFIYKYGCELQLEADETI